jgi:hypothetical protein
MRRAWLLLAVTAALGVSVAAPAHAATQAPQDSVHIGVGDVAPPDALPVQDPLSPRLFLPYSDSKPPPAFTVSANQARQTAERLPEVRDARAAHPRMRGIVYLSPLRLRQGSFWHWDIIYSEGGKDVVEVELAPTGQVLQITEPPDIGWPLLLGLPGVLGGRLNSPWLWIPLCLLFLLPFFDPRRPLRLLHLDLLMLLAFGISHAFFNAGKPGISVPLVYPFLIYAAGRAAWAGFRPARRAGPLIPWLSTRVLIAGVVVLMVLRGLFGAEWSVTFDVATAGTIGADRIEHGLPLYVDNEAHGDTYGPVNYLLYVPWEIAFPFKPPVAEAARGATLMFDTLIVLGLFLLGRSLRRGPPGTRLGAALAWAWVAFPYTTLVIASTTNDFLVPLFLIYALLLLRWAPARSAVAALGTMAKFAPALVAPVLAAGRGPLRLRPAIAFSAVYAAVCAALIYAFLPDGGLREFWNTTLGFQLGRSSPLSIWTREPSIEWMRHWLSAFAVLLAVTAAFLPRRRTTGQVAALCAAILAVGQIPANYWLYFYIVWFAPFLLIALAEEYRDLGPGQASVTSDFVKPEMISQPSPVTATRSSMRTPSLPGK